MNTPYPVAILCSDLHLTLQIPACRADKDWMAVQAGYLKQLKDIADRLPIICAGDIFDRWNAPPELINFALQRLPDGMLCVPGQHDLPNHRIDLMHRSGYGVLVEAEKIVDLNIPYQHKDFFAYGAGWEQPIPKPLYAKERIAIAVVHRYCWIDGKSYPGAPDTTQLGAYKKELKGYDAAVFGDNHLGFLTNSGDCAVINCGGFIRRKSDEIDYQPSVGVLFSDGTIKRKKLDISGDKFQTIEPGRREVPVNMKEFIDQLEGLGEHGLNFKEAVENHLRENDDIEPETKEMITKAMEPV